MAKIDDPVARLPFVGPTYTKKLEKLKIFSINDLVFHFPFRYDDYSIISPICRLQTGEAVTIVGEVIEIKNEYTKGGKKIQKARVKDSSGEAEILWFNQPFLVRTIKKGLCYNFSGKVEWFGRKVALISPDYELCSSQSLHTGRIVPVYNETAGVSSKWLRQKVKTAINLVGEQFEEFLPMETVEREGLLSEKKALVAIHFPSNKQEEKQARYRLAFDELFLIQLSALLRKQEWQKKTKGRKLFVEEEKINNFKDSLPFKLTGAQERCVAEILTDLQKEIPANRLLVGDVGSGKTVVAAITALVAFLNGLKTLLMAPTEILANQHYQSLKKIFKDLQIPIEIITGSQKSIKKAKGAVKTESDQAAIIVGTHALLHQEYDNVGLVIIDEQHRFGVKQRELLTRKGVTPHVLTMTATPIPRTIVLTLYNDLDLSIIDEMPPGRATTKTWVVPNHKRQDAYQWIKKKVKDTPEQCFIICPLVEESESLSSVKAATKEFENLSHQVFPDLRLGLLHGRVKAEEKNKILNEFKDGKLDVLVATPVVEVGIDIPNATIMVIEAADRFGLAQLHQLRGRIGRRETASFCFLFSENTNPLVTERLKSLEKTTLGIQLAEIDLKLRGPGEIYGTKQHGFFDLKVASYNDLDLIKKTRAVAGKMVSNQKLSSALQSRLNKYKIESVIN